MPSNRPPGPYTDPPRPSSPTVELTAGTSRAVIATRGAEPVDWTVAGRALLWDGDETWWPKSSPVLFPLCGQTLKEAIRVNGVSYPIPVHGFAPTTRFTVADKGPDRVRMTLAVSPETRAAYPFDFAFAVDYHLTESAFRADFEIRNIDSVTMPYAVGYHPGFNWPFADGDKHSHSILFEREENPMVPEVGPGAGFLKSKVRVPLDGRRLALPEGLFQARPLCFFNSNSRSLRFEDGAGSAIVVDTENFPHFAIWTKPDAPYLSIEEWTGYADPAGFDGELADKPSMLFLKPGETARHAVTLSFENGL